MSASQGASREITGQVLPEVLPGVLPPLEKGGVGSTTAPSAARFAEAPGSTRKHLKQ
jgi:hypothetical protein